MKICIAVVAFNKIKPLERLLSSLSKLTNSPNSVVDLCFSIDGGGAPQIESMAKNFQWNNGDKIVNLQPENLGLKKNIYATMKFGLDYDALIILEDDLYVSTQLIKYVEIILAHYKNINKIAGFSLYSSNFNETA
jgi:GT2 family glycosyltransferase